MVKLFLYDLNLILNVLNETCLIMLSNLQFDYDLNTSVSNWEKDLMN